MSGEKRARPRVDRRTTLKWLAATVAAAQAGCGGETPFVGPEIPPAPARGDALLGAAAAPDHAGYGVDPDLMHPSVPWSRTLSDGQLQTASALADMILPADGRSPAASDVGVPDFVDEWLSAPYPRQQEDRGLIFDGLEWLEAECRARSDRSFAMADVATRTELLELLADSGPGSLVPARMLDFFRRLRAERRLVFISIHPTERYQIDIIRRLCDEYLFVFAGHISRYAAWDAFIADAPVQQYLGDMLPAAL